jgi:uncharacterized damage-inducible protein DinB
MHLTDPLRTDFNRLYNFLHQVSPVHYTQPQEVLSGATVGQHVRHIIEFYAIAFQATHGNVINYDNRKRDVQLETNPAYACQCIDALQEKLSVLTPDRELFVTANYHTQLQQPITLVSSVYRELAYALDHSTHHQAILKIALTNLPESPYAVGDMGMAHSTLRYKNQLDATPHE